MPITLDCPRCQTSLSAPEKMAGQYAFCPKCQGRMWVPAEGTATRTTVGAAAAPAMSVMEAPKVGRTSTSGPPSTAVDPMAPVKATVTPPTATSFPMPPQPAAPPGGSPARSIVDRPGAAPPVPPTVAHPSTSIEAPPAVTPPPTRRVAQFITADVAQSQLTLAADGKLPELHLSTDDAGPRKRKSLAAGNSWGMVALVSLSLLAALAVLLIPGPSDRVDAPSNSAQDSRTRLRRYYLGNEGVELRPYQVILRRSQQAYDRGDRKAEREYYLEIMKMLRDENLHPRGRSLTGMLQPAEDHKLPNDENLEEYIATLLGER